MPGMIVADIGSGIGYFALPITQQIGTTGHVYAIDIYGDVLKRLNHDAREKNITNITTLVCDAEKKGGIPLKNETVDMVLVINTLFQSGNHQAILLESLRILKTGGSIVIIEWVDSFNNLGPIPEHVVSVDSVHTLAQSLGLVYVRDIGNPGIHHFGLIFQK